MPSLRQPKSGNGTPGVLTPGREPLHQTANGSATGASTTAVPANANYEKERFSAEKRATLVEQNQYRFGREQYAHSIRSNFLTQSILRTREITFFDQ